jgi:hypothetical protein
VHFKTNKLSLETKRPNGSTDVCEWLTIEPVANKVSHVRAVPIHARQLNNVAVTVDQLIVSCLQWWELSNGKGNTKREQHIFADAVP